jgi:hypothetical protein
LSNLQRLLAEGQFVATCNYALLLSLADIAVEAGDDSGAPLNIPARQIAEKFVQYYWRQVVPYVPKTAPASGQVLKQNTGRQASIIRQVLQARVKHGGSRASAERDRLMWKSLVRDVDQVVRQMPLWKLQTVGRSNFDFLYENHGKGISIELRAGVAYSLRKFYVLIGELIRGAWVRYVQRNNHDVPGTTADLSEFLFGSERSNLAVVRQVLEDTQKGRCFYCRRTMRAPRHVDHFIPWSKYPVDLGHNFVIAHQSCNTAKADHLAAADHLETWIERNLKFGEELSGRFATRGITHHLPTTLRIADWAYVQTSQTGGLTWVRSQELAALPADWRRILSRLEGPN